jgi:hypothetical protein
VMALAGHHVESPSADDHRHTALKLLRESLNASGKLSLSTWITSEHHEGAN